MVDVTGCGSVGNFISSVHSYLISRQRHLVAIQAGIGFSGLFLRNGKKEHE